MDNPQQGMVSLAQARERVIQRLTEAFSNDLITVEELERRLEHVYQSQTPAETEAIVADLRAVSGGSLPAPNPDEPRQSRDLPTVPQERFVVILSSTARRGVWSVPNRLDALAVFSDSVIDLTHATLPADIVDIHVRIFGASMKIVIPAGLRVVNRVGAFLANVETDTSLDLAPMVQGMPVVRITGHATMANLEVVAAPGRS